MHLHQPLFCACVSDLCLMHTLDQLRAGYLAGVTRLDLSAGLTEFPREIFDLADSLEILNLSGNALSSLPTDLPRLHRLRVLFCSDNQFTAVPEVLGQCPQLSMVGFKANQLRTLPAAALPPLLRWLILTDNQLESLPPEIGDCLQLQKLMLAATSSRPCLKRWRSAKTWNCCELRPTSLRRCRLGC
jgi:Leucine-rich repeat (LRR) protein